MNQEKIGHFIAAERKHKNLTQEQLAEKLGVSKNAVSKWERGICLMDMSLLKPLSEILEASINDILAGERIPDQDFKHKSEENVRQIAELVELRTMKKGVIGMAIYFIILVLISTYKEISPAPLVSLICAYNGITFFSRWKIDKSRENLISGVLFIAATVLNTISFIIL